MHYFLNGHALLNSPQIMHALFIIVTHADGIGRGLCIGLGMFVCLFVFFFVCVQNFSRTGERFCTKFSGNVRIVKGKNRLDFGDDWLPPANSV